MSLHDPSAVSDLARPQSDVSCPLAAVDELQALEKQRCAAISALDLAVLGGLLDDQLVHVHANGNTEDRDAYLAALGGRPRTTTPQQISVRLVGDDVAIMTGTLRNESRKPDGTVFSGEIHALRVWRRHDGSWLLTAFAASPLGARP